MEWVALEITPGDCWIQSPGAAFLAVPFDSAHCPLLLCLVDSDCLERALGVPVLARYRPAALNPATELEWVPSEHGSSPAVVFPDGPVAKTIEETRYPRAFTFSRAWPEAGAYCRRAAGISPIYSLSC